MEFVLGAAAGLVWGILIALLNNRITKASLKTEKTVALMGPTWPGPWWIWRRWGWCSCCETSCPSALTRR